MNYPVKGMIRLIKIGERLVRQARRLTIHLAEVRVSRNTFDVMLERIGRLRPVPGYLNVPAGKRSQIGHANGRVRNL